jgi:hypothetical protein
MVGFPGAVATKIPWNSGTYVEAGRTLNLIGYLNAFGRLTGTITTPAGHDSASICIDVVPKSGSGTQSTCLAPGVRTYDVAAADGPFTAHFRSDDPWIAGEWAGGTPFGANATQLVVDPGGLKVVDVDLAVGGKVDVSVQGIDGQVLSDGCVELLGSDGLAADHWCAADGAAEPVFQGVTPGDYKVRATSFAGYNDGWSGSALTLADAETVTVTAGNTSEVTLTLGNDSGAWFSVTHNGAPARGGCVVAYDKQWNLAGGACDDAPGRIGLPELPAGQYYALFVGFDDGGAPSAADLWWGGTPSFEAAQLLTVTAAGATSLAMDLPDGGSLAGNVSVSYGSCPCSGRLEVYTKKLEYVDSTDTTEYGGFEIRGLPEGDYFIKFIGVAGTANQWMTTSSGSNPGARSTVHVDPSYDGAPDLWLEVDMTVTTAVGTLSRPVGWTASEICIAAYYTAATSSWPADFFSGSPGEHYELTSLRTDKAYKFRVIAGHITRRDAWPAFKGASRWVGNSSSASGAAIAQLGRAKSYYVPTYFYSDVTAKTASFWQISWLGDYNIYRPSAHTFRPESTMTRRDLATYLYKLAGSPKVTLPSKSPFTDVKTTDAAYKPLLWLRSKKVWTNTTFKPSAGLDKKTEALILYRVAGSPSVTLPSKNPYKDIKSSDSAYKAITWANKYHIVSKSSSTTYGATSLVKRKYGAASLYEWWWRFG